MPTTPKNGSETRRVIKRWCVEEKGGKCAICGYNNCLDALDFHHLNESDKDFVISDRNLVQDWDIIK